MDGTLIILEELKRISQTWEKSLIEKVKRKRSDNMDELFFHWWKTQRLNKINFREFIKYCQTNKARVKRIKRRK